MHPVEAIASKLLGAPDEALDPVARKVTHHIATRKHIARNLAQAGNTIPTFGQSAADAVAAFGGSWTFVGLFTGSVLLWIVVNTLLLLHQGATFDPYPYILLNLFLSMLAAIQAPVILMSQNRQSEKDRIRAEHDYEVNLKAELEIMLLHEKLDELRQTQWEALLAMQREQLEKLTKLAPWSQAPSL